jgi:branched-chain amino acid transport system ATP-binding protein
MDEPSMGLAPVLVAQSFEIIQQINEAGTTVFVVEQNANMALSIADRGYVLQTGQIVLADTAKGLLANPEMRAAYLGEVE